MEISGISPSDKSSDIKGTASVNANQKEIVIPLAGEDSDDKPKKFELIFDKDGYPVPDGETLKVSEKGLFKKRSEYTYKANGKESVNDIKAKFHLKDGALRKCNPYIVDAEWIPEKGRDIYFMKDDIDTGK